MFISVRSTEPLLMTPSTSITAILLPELVCSRTSSSNARERSETDRLRGMTPREKLTRWLRRLKTNSAIKINASAFQTAWFGPRGGGGGGLEMMGGGASGGGGGLAGGAWT